MKPELVTKAATPTDPSLDVMFYEAFDEEAEAIRRFVPDGLRAAYTGETIQESGDDSPPARLVSTRTQSVIPPAWAKGIAGVLTRSTGYDHVDAFRRECERDVPAGYLPSYCARAVAEHCMLLWTALLRKLPQQIEQFRRFNRDGLTGRECRGRTVLVVGVGNIGSEVVKIARGLEMTALGVDIVRRHDGVEYVDLDDGLPRADVIVCAMNLTRENAGMLNYERLARAKPDAVFVNCARGELAPPGDLVRLINEGRLGGIGLDVYDDEPRRAGAVRRGRLALRADRLEDASIGSTFALAEWGNVICTPHNAFNTAEALERKARRSVEAVVAFLETGAFPEPVPDT